MPAPTGLDVFVDREEYSRYERDRDTIRVTIVPAGVGLAGEQVTVRLTKARRNRDVSVATVTLTLVDDNPIGYQFDLNSIVDEGACPTVRRGEYFVQVESVSDSNIKALTSDFRITMVTVDRLKADYLHGVDLKSSDVLSVKNQPVVITGVTVESVSQAHPQGFFDLTYTYVDDGAGNIQRFLSWCSGPLVEIVSGKTVYILRFSTTNSYIEVKVDELLLPTENKTEDLFIDKKALDEERIRDIIDQAISWVEDVELHIYIEPTTIITELDPTQLSYGADSDIPQFVGADWDCKVDALTYYRASAGHWISIRFPYFPLIRIDELYGKVSNTRILDVALEWIEIQERGGFVELVPFNQEVAFNFIGLVWVESLRGPVPIPNFWNFTARAGFCKVPAALIELVAKKAAIDLLTIAGQAFRGGVSSTSLSRDGVSESVSYTASATYGIYSATIEDYRKWIEKTLKKFRASFKGPTMFVM